MTAGSKRRSPSAASEMSAETRARDLTGETSRPWLDQRDSSTPSSSPISAPNSPDRHSDDIEDNPEDNLMPLDPRRFTPTLHASLVSEILNLRREAESKTKEIDVLERNLDESRTENEDLGASLAQSIKEARSLKHQLKHLEGGTSSTMTELAKERDDALENIADIRKKFEQTQKKTRSREEDVDRTQTLWDRERESWETERRKLERKVHVVENRLRTVLSEVAAAQAAGSFNKTPKTNGGGITLNGEGDSDTASVYSSSQGRRRTSVTSMSTDDGDMQNNRFSVMSIANVNGNKGDGFNLAEELDFDELDEFASLEHDSTSDSPGALPEERPTSAHSQLSSHTMGMKARKILGLSLQGNRNSTEDDAVPEAKSPTKIPLPSSPFPYQDAGIQYSPPSSPDARGGNNNPKDSGTLTLAIDMVSTSCQTVGDLPSPPWTPKVASESSSPPPSPTPVQVNMVSTSTQTEPASTTDGTPEKRTSLSPQDAISTGMEIPMIAIHPPSSEPPSPRNSVVLPPQTKSASCQTDVAPKADEGRSIAIQTEEIRVDQRPVKIPASLLPSAIPDVPLRSEARLSSSRPRPVPLPRSSDEEKRPPPRSSREEKRLPPRSNREEKKLPPPPPTARRPSEDQEVPGPLGHIQAYPGNNDNGPLSKVSSKPGGVRRPLRSSSLFAGFEQEDSVEKKTGDIFTDDELLNRPLATYTLSRGKMVSTRDRPQMDTTTLPEIEEHLSDAKMQLFESAIGNHEGPDPVGSSRAGPRSGAAGTPGPRQQDIRRAAMITSGTVAHQRTRAMSPSEPSTIDSKSSSSSIAPPIPVPARHSSRQFPAGGSDGRQSPTPSSYSRDHPDRQRPSIARAPTLRRVRSATTVSQSSQPDLIGTPQSPDMSIFSFDTDSSRKPSLPFDDLAAPPPRPPHRRQSSWRDDPFGRERQDSTAGSIQSTSVVDAIAQTMIGEWMFKYIRRRSFGSGGDLKDNWEGRNTDEVSANITNSGSRHKRWVWLAPYERAIMWSSKQPTSGPALLGKSGRKLTIQSVLDVKDDNPLPKGSSPQSQFNRSILVLTPQRALKFTATSIERHYVWLTALSFLSHSSMGAEELASLPSAPREESASPTVASVRKTPIRERVAKAARPRPYPKTMRPFANKPEAPVNGLDTIDDDDDSIFDAAAPPTVPMFSNHGRKRSNTAPRMPSVRTFSGLAGSVPSAPSSTVGSFDAYQRPAHAPSVNSTRSSFSRRTSEVSGPSGPSSSMNGTTNFFDAVGTVRMEAFIGQSGVSRGHAPQSSRHSRKTSSQWSPGHQHDLDFPGFVRNSESSSRFEDPFREF